MSFHIRPFTPGDYAALLAISSVIYPDYAATEDELRYWDEHRDPTHKFQRWVAEQNGRVVGVAHYNQSMENHHPRKFWLDIMVHPDAQRQGIGSALYEQVVTSVKQYDPINLRGRTREDMLPGIRFLQARGFQDVWRDWESRLDVTTFDPTPYQGLEAKLRQQGIEIKTLTELESDPERYHKLHEMENEVAQDIPSLDAITPISFEQFMDLFINNSQSSPDAHFVAVHDGEYIGTTGLWKSDADPDFTNNLTGVKRAYRHRGIALALKLRGIAYAREHGGTTIKTWNDSPNAAMIAINMQLGFVRKIGWITFLKEFEEEANVYHT
ncbi:MAG TPA: GNAT family N-acetyltransferase [Ktedonobacteraceae bacterium]|nr:GNAT family N-acetyltransferase [Ktedonobacteraceae bacterium]